MSKPARDGAAVYIPPPFLFVIPIGLGISLGRSFPLPFPLEDTLLRTALGTISGLLGVLLIGLGFLQFRRTRQAPEPWKPTPEIIRDGIYRYTRNPMYLGMSLLQVGFGIARGNFWIIAFVFVSIAAVQYLAILPEEAYLERKFGEEYLTYKASAGRWWGRK